MSPSGGSGCPTAAGVAISSTGFAPKSVCIVQGGTVTFSNTDTIGHDVEGVPTVCTLLNFSVAPSASHPVTGTIPSTCGFADAAHLGDPAFFGTLIVGAGGGGGGGY